MLDLLNACRYILSIYRFFFLASDHPTELLFFQSLQHNKALSVRQQTVKESSNSFIHIYPSYPPLIRPPARSLLFICCSWKRVDIDSLFFFLVAVCLVFLFDCHLTLDNPLPPIPSIHYFPSLPYMLQIKIFMCKLKEILEVFLSANIPNLDCILYESPALFSGENQWQSGSHYQIKFGI